jgi:hypothetical protein
MRSVVIALLHLSFSISANQEDPKAYIEVVTVNIPPAGEVISTAGTDVIMIRGLPEDAEPVELPQGWEAEAAPGGGPILLQGPAVGNTFTIKFTSPDPDWEAEVAGFKGMESLWNAGPLNRDSVGISITTMKAGAVINSTAAKCFNAKRKMNRDTSTHVDNGNMRGEPATTTEIFGTWISDPSLGQLGMTQSSFTFRESGMFSQKIDFISFCDGCNRGIDCDYFWIIYEGRYTGNAGDFKINVEKEQRVLLRVGQTQPEITETPNYSNSYDIQVGLSDDSLLIRKRNDSAATLFHREN